LTALLLFLSCTALHGPARTPRYTIESPEAIHRDCELDTFDEKGLEGMAANGRFKAANILELRRDSLNLPPLLTRDFVLLTTGDRIRLDAGAGAVLEENRFVIWPAKSSFPAANAKGLSLYLPYVVAALWSIPEGVDDTDLFVTQLHEESRKRDAILLKNGDRIDGALANLTTKTGAAVTVGVKRIETPWAKIAGLALSTERAVRPRTKKPFARVVLEDGSRVSFQDLRLDRKTRQFTGKTLFGTTLEFPESALVALDMRQDLATELS
jgi:hypothetical protein